MISILTCSHAPARVEGERGEEGDGPRKDGEAARDGEGEGEGKSGGGGTVLVLVLVLRLVSRGREIHGGSGTAGGGEL